MSMRKEEGHAQFACFVRNVTEQPIPLTVPFGRMAGRPKLTDEEYDALRERNRRRYAATSATWPTDPDPDPEKPRIL